MELAGGEEVSTYLSPSADRLSRDMNAEEREQLLLEFREQIWPLCYRSAAGNLQDANDIYQETCLRALKRLDTYDSSRPFLAWLRTIAASTAVDFHRAKKREEARRRKSSRINRPTELDAEGRAERQRALNRALAELDPQTRNVLTLRYHDNLSWDEIGKATNMTREAVKKRLLRGRERLRKILFAEMKEDR